MKRRMKRYVVRWYEKPWIVSLRYMCFKLEFVRKKDAEGMFKWLSYGEIKSSVRSVSIYDKESKKTIKKYVPRY